MLLFMIPSLLLSALTIHLMWYDEYLWRKRLGKHYDPDTALMLVGGLFALIPFINLIYFLFCAGKVYDNLSKYKKQ